VGDEDTHDRIVRVARSGKAAAWSMWGVGGAMALGGMAYTLGNISSDRPLVPGLVVMTAGFTLAPLSGIPAAAVRREGWVGSYYTPEEVDRWIGEYNAAQAATHGISEADSLSVELTR